MFYSKRCWMPIHTACYRMEYFGGGRDASKHGILTYAHETHRTSRPTLYTALVTITTEHYDIMIVNKLFMTCKQFGK